MKRIQTILCLLLAFTSIKVQAQFVYPNEDCAGAIPLPVNPSTEYIDFIDQDEDMADPATSAISPCSGVAKNDLWYTFTATHTDHFVRVMGANLNTELFSGTCGALTSISCLKDFIGLTIGQTYYVRVYKNPAVLVSNNIASHLYLLSPPTNDDCTNATLLMVNPPNSPLKSLRQFNTKFATPSTSSCTNNPVWATYKDLWFQFVATSSSNSVYWSGCDLRFYSGTLGSFTLLGGGTSAEQSKTLNNLVIGQSYYIRAGSASVADVNLKIAVADIPNNDECSNADTVKMSSSIGCENSFMVTSLSATSSTTPCTPTMSNDTWYVFKATSANVLITRESTQNPSTSFGLLDGACNALTCLVANSTNELSYNGLTVGNYYYLRVSNSFFYNSIAVCISPAITNNDCSGATTINVQAYGSNTTVKGTNFSATQSLPRCVTGGLAEDVWYQFTAIDTACFIDVKMAYGNSNFEVSSGSCTSPTSILCINSDGSKRLSNLTIGNTYFIRCYAQFISSNSMFTISLTGLLSNDACANAKTINTSTNLDYLDPSNNGLFEAAVSLPPCSTTIYSKDVWYKFTPSTSTAAIISHADVIGGNAFYQVYAGNCSALTSMICFSQGTNEFHKALTLSNLSPSQTYYIRQYGDKYKTSLSVVNPPTNDLISGAIQLKPSPSSVQKLPSYSLHGAGKSFGRICTNFSVVISHDVWFYFIVQNTSHNVSITSFNSFWEEQNTGITYRMEAFKGYAADSLGLSIKKIPCTATPFALTGLTVGDTIYLRVYNVSPLGTTTIFSIDVNNTQNIDEPIGALTLDAINDYQYQLSTTGATQTLPPANCKAVEFSDDDIWLKFTHSNTSKRIIAGYESKDIVLELFSGTPGSLTSLFCSNNIMLLPTNLSIGVQYYVRAYSKANTQASTFRIGLFDDGNALSNSCINPSLLGPNLVKNPKCESDYALMPGISVDGGFMTGAPLAKDWWSTNSTTADIWDADYPSGFWGSIPEITGAGRETIPHGGKGILGVFYENAYWCEYVTGELMQALTPGKSYMVSFYAIIDVASGSNIGKTLRQVGALLTEDRIRDANSVAFPYVPNIALPENAPLIESRTWRHVCGIVKADFPYRFITLGNFGNSLVYGDPSKYHYMYLDDVFVGEIPDSLASNLDAETVPFNFNSTQKNTIKLEVFPNPANDRLMVKWNNEPNNERSQIMINDLSGRAVWQSELFPLSVTETQINLQKIPVGFYTITLVGYNKRASTKLIIAR
jgi:hypothetical protein